MTKTEERINEALDTMFDRGYSAGKKYGMKLAEIGDYAALSMLLMLYYIHDPDMIELLDKKKDQLKEQYFVADSLREQRKLFESNEEENTNADYV